MKARRLVRAFRYLFPLPAFIKKKGTGTEPMPFIALWLR
jgi:hypothetical protein